jgi:glucose/arabinose dehydrogenase
MYCIFTSKIPSKCVFQWFISFLDRSGNHSGNHSLIYSCGRIFLYTALALGLHLSVLHFVAAQTPPGGFSSVVISSEFSEAVGLTFSKDGNDMFVWERTGKVWVVTNNQTQLLLDISQEVGSWHDHGLLGFALHPQFETNGYFYVLYVVDRHYLMNVGTAAYDPAKNEYFAATIGRLALYKATKTGNIFSVDPASRKILIGQTRSSSIAILSKTHGVGSLVFGTDGTLLISSGDGASPSSVDVGSAVESYYSRALADGIITPLEDVGSLRSQLLESLNGKILRIDPMTGEGIPSNPFYDASDPNSVRSKIWALGFRNPFRMNLKPGTGSTDKSEANPGVLYVGDVGWNTWEEINVVNKGGMNFGWPIFEGLEAHEVYSNTRTSNPYTPNPLFLTNNCTQQYFTFQDLIQQTTASGIVSFKNPCDNSQTLPDSVTTFIHSRPIIDWKHGTGPARTGIFNGERAAVINVGATGSPVTGPQFGGSSSTGGVFYTGSDFPPEYKNTYFHGDYGAEWIRNISLTADDKPVSVKNFINIGASVVAMTTHPIQGGLYYIHLGTEGAEIRRIYYGANRPPVPVAIMDKMYGTSPLQVQFTGSNSSDPEGSPLTYEWNFGDGTAVSTLANPTHTFIAPAGIPTKYIITLKVTNTKGASAINKTLFVSVNNTPPEVTITSPVANSVYPIVGQITYNLRATVTDLEHTSSQLLYEWQTLQHHNTHTHPGAIDTLSETTTIISPEGGCDGQTYFFEIVLKVTDGAGLTGTHSIFMQPDCFSLVDNVKNATATAGNKQISLNWINPNSFDEILIVAKTGVSIAGVPKGDGSAYEANLDFQGFSTTFDRGKVVYKGTVPPQTITHLTNNITYYFKIFTRKGTLWSKGVQVQAIPFGPIIQEMWANVAGTSVASIPVTTPPTSTSPLWQFESPMNVANNFGSRIRAFIHIPVSGSYTFWTASDDNSELWLSTDDTPANKQKIAFVDRWTLPQQWTKFPSQQSTPVYLQEGHKYYIEALHKEGLYSDHLSVGWQLPGGGALERPIPGFRLSPYVVASNTLNNGLVGYWPLNETSGSIATDQSNNNNNGTLINSPLWTAEGKVQGALQSNDLLGRYVSVPSLTWKPTNFSVAWWLYPFSLGTSRHQLLSAIGWGGFMFHTTLAGEGYVGTDVTNRITSTQLPAGTVEINKWHHFVFTYEGGIGKFYKNGQLFATKAGMLPPKAWGGFKIGNTGAAGFHGKIDEVRVYNRALLSSEVYTLASVNNFPQECTASGKILREYWANIPGTSIASIPVNIPPTSTSQLTLFEAPINIGDNYGTRIRGYICPPSSGEYTFWITGDENSELWLSTDDNVSNKRRLVFSARTNPREWVRYPHQQSEGIYLQAKQRYYIEALQKEGTGGDNLAVGWQLPSGTLERPIPGSRLYPYIVPAITTADSKSTFVSHTFDITAYPNPFSKQVRISFVMPENGNAQVEIYNGQGSAVSQVIEQKKERGAMCVLDFDGTHLPNGLYFIRVSTNQYVSIKKLLLSRSK